MVESILGALGMAFAMGWEILWPLILGSALSAVVQAVVSHREMARLLPDDRPRSIAKALALGAASSSCSYAAVALARSLFRKGPISPPPWPLKWPPPISSSNSALSCWCFWAGSSRRPSLSARQLWSDCWFCSSAGFSNGFHPQPKLLNGVKRRLAPLLLWKWKNLLFKVLSFCLGKLASRGVK